MNLLVLKYFTRACEVLTLGALLFLPTTSQAKTNIVSKLKVPTGFKIELFAENLPNARTMVSGDRATVFVGTRNAGECTRSKIIKDS